MAVIADKCPNIQIDVHDLNNEEFQIGIIIFKFTPYYEPGLAEIVKV